jgi:hypothetical protein
MIYKRLQTFSKKQVLRNHQFHHRCAVVIRNPQALIVVRLDRVALRRIDRKPSEGAFAGKAHMLAGAGESPKDYCSAEMFPQVAVATSPGIRPMGKRNPSSAARARVSYGPASNPYLKIRSPRNSTAPISTTPFQTRKKLAPR